MKNYIKKYFSLLMTLLIFVSNGCKTSKEPKGNDPKQGEVFEINIDDFGARGNGKQDDTPAFQKAINKSDAIQLNLTEGKNYFIKDLYIGEKKELIINGNNATLTIPRGEIINNFLLIEACEKVKLSNLTIKGNTDQGANVKEFAIRINTPNYNTKQVIVENVNIENTNYGGIIVHNISKTGKYKTDFTAGAKDIKVNNCRFVDFGTRGAVFIRGSHQNVEVTNCTADHTRPIRTGGVFGFSAEVSIPQDMVGKVVVKNIKVNKATSKALFFQQVREVEVDGFVSDQAGFHNIKDLKKFENLTIIKIDDLGKGNKAHLKNCTATNTVKGLKGSAFFAVEQTKNKKFGHTSNVILEDFKTDKRIRLAASGNNILRNGTIFNEWISIGSMNNRIEGVNFDNASLRIMNDNNVISQCRFKEKGIVFFRNMKNSIVENCKLEAQKTGRSLITIESHKPREVTKVNVIDCEVPQGSYLVRVAGSADHSEGVIIETNKKKEELKLHPHIKARGVFKKTDKN